MQPLVIEVIPAVIGLIGSVCLGMLIVTTLNYRVRKKDLKEIQESSDKVREALYEVEETRASAHSVLREAKRFHMHVVQDREQHADELTKLRNRVAGLEGALGQIDVLLSIEVRTLQDHSDSKLFQVLCEVSKLAKLHTQTT